MTPDDARREAERIAAIIREMCPACGGSGATGGPAPLVTKDMAADAESPELEGMPYGPDTTAECEYCGRPMRAVADAIAQALAARQPRDGHVIDDKGVERKVLGTLPLTQQGDVIGDGAWCWKMLPGVKGKDDDKPMRIMYRTCPVTDPDAYDGQRIVHSTRETASAAQEQP